MNFSVLPRINRKGVTLIELIVSIVVVSIALVGVLSVMNLITARSADPLLLHQGVAIAESYLEEILLRPFADPDGVDGEASRPLFDDVNDYDGLSDTGARDQSGSPIAGLGNYTVEVIVTGQALGGIPAADVWRVEVTVTDPVGSALSLVGYRTAY